MDTRKSSDCCRREDSVYDKIQITFEALSTIEQRGRTVCEKRWNDARTEERASSVEVLWSR